MIRTNNYFNVFSSTVSYACLLACSLYISRNAFYQYQNGKTSFQLTQDQLTLEELPAITICYNGLHQTFEQYEQLRSNNSAIARDWMIKYLILIQLHEHQTIEPAVQWHSQR